LPVTSIEHARRSRSVPTSSVSPAATVSTAVAIEAVEAAAVQSVKPVLVEIEGIEVET
jgi:hypothetical protein